MKKTSRIYYTHLIIPVFALLLTCCSSNSDTAASEPKPSHSFFRVIADTVTGSVKGAFQAVQSPLEDINLKRAPIPDPLKNLPANPYALPVPVNCAAVEKEIAGINTALGPDVYVVDDGKGYDNSSLTNTWHTVHNISWQNRDAYMDRSSSFIQQQAADQVRSHVEIFPYRSWVRWISGADAHAKKVAEAFEAGKVRRAFLRGVEVNLHCVMEGPVMAPKPLEVKKDSKPAPAEEVEETALNDEK